MERSSTSERLASLSPQQREAVLRKLRERKAQSVQDRGRVDETPIPRVRHDGEIPLSFGQQRLLFLDQMEGPNPYYNEFGAHRIHGELDASALETAFQRLIERHEILRTTFPFVNGNPVQRIAEDSPFSLERVDLSRLSAPEYEQTLKDRMTSEPVQAFQLSEGPLLRAVLLKRSSREHVLLTTMHHIICDNWSSAIFNRELISLYLESAGSSNIQLPELPVQYADFSEWQRGMLTSERADEMLNYWRGALEPLPPPLALPTDWKRPAHPTYEGFNTPVEWSEELTQALKEAGQPHGATLFMVVLAAYAVLLARYGCQEELVIGVPISNRSRNEWEALIGFFVNTLLIKIDFRSNPTFEELIGRVVQSASGAYRNQDLPLDRLMEALDIQRDTPLFRAMLIFQNAPQAVLDAPGLSIEPIEMPSEFVRSDIDFYLTEERGQLRGSLRCNRDLFSPATIEAFRDRFRHVLEYYVLPSSVPIDDLQFERSYRLPPIPLSAGTMSK